ncbi:hypothetical protein D0T23_30415 [Duganella sp. BJB475]|nr:hypothetical protein D0T23_30415 [Duganella sp. BJB475]RFP36175.1 hypothetical protein D0T21_06995 [Duganella sp. BJB476]
MAQGILNGVLPSVSNPTLKTAIMALMAAANAVCSSSSTSSARLAHFNLVAPAGQEDFLAGLSDNQLQVLADVQRQASQGGHITAADVGTYVF